MLGSVPALRGRRVLVSAVAGAALLLPVGLAGVALAPAALAVTPAVATSTTLTVTPSTPNLVVGTWLTLSAHLTAPGPTTAELTGTLTISEGSTPVATTTVALPTGTSTVDVALAHSVKVMVAGVHTYLATFTTSSTDFDGSVSAPATATIVRVPTRTNLSAAPVVLVAGKVLTLRATVAPGAGGTVRFTDGARLVGTVRVDRGVAALRLVPTGGNHYYRAWFVPGVPALYAASVSPVVKVVSRAATALPLGAGTFGPLVILLQNRLNWNGIPTRVSGVYDAATIAAVKRFQGKFFLRVTGVTDRTTMNLLARLAVTVPPRSCTSVQISICVDKTRKIAQLIVNGRIVLSLDARFGSTSSPALETREGIFRVQRKDATHVSSAYHTPMPWSMFFSGGQAVHYSKYFAAVGYNGASHGCVNIRDWNGVKTMFSMVRIGTRVVVYRS